MGGQPPRGRGSRGGAERRSRHFRQSTQPPTVVKPGPCASEYSPPSCSLAVPAGRCRPARMKPRCPPSVPDSGAAEAGGPHEDRGGDADFRAAASKAFASDPATARSALEAFLANHPDHRQRPAALALLARVQIASGDAAGAKATLEKADAGARTPDFDFLLGIAASRLGNPVLAVALLRPFLASGPPRIGGLATPMHPCFCTPPRPRPWPRPEIRWPPSSSGISIAVSTERASLSAPMRAAEPRRWPRRSPASRAFRPEWSSCPVRARHARGARRGRVARAGRRSQRRPAGAGHRPGSAQPGS